VKKTIKNIALVLVMGIMLVLLTGCGGNKLVATKASEDDTMGKYNEKIEITFKNNKANEIKMTYEFEDKSNADSMYSSLNLGMAMAGEEVEGLKVEQDDKKVIMTMDSKAFEEQEGTNDEEMTKDALKAKLEEQGYKVK
jgi:hypothetical protein